MRGSVVIVAAAGSLLLAVACSTPYGDAASNPSPSSADKETAGATDSTDPAPTAPAPIPASGGSGSGTSNGGAGHPDGGTGVDASPADPANCPAKSVASVTPWNAPPAASAACSSADITYFGQVAANQTWLGIESLMKTRNPACSTCIFSHDTDASWHAVIYSGAEGNAIVNYAACFASASGGSEACGRSVWEWSDCYARVCDSAACGTDDAVTACYNSPGASDACAAYSPITACGGAEKYASTNNICNSYIDTARALCAAGH
jgi:hypothetical protein